MFAAVRPGWRATARLSGVGDGTPISSPARSPAHIQPGVHLPLGAVCGGALGDLAGDGFDALGVDSESAEAGAAGVGGGAVQGGDRELLRERPGRRQVVSAHMVGFVGGPTVWIH